MKNHFFLPILLTAHLAGQAQCPPLIDSTPEKGPILGMFDTKKLPSYPGGESCLYFFLAENLHYPETACTDSLEGVVIVQFLVEKDGSRSGYQICRDIGSGCGEEAIRLLRLMPNWSPGETNGNPQRFKYVMPIKFRKIMCDTAWNPYGAAGSFVEGEYVIHKAVSPLGDAQNVQEHLLKNKAFQKGLKRFADLREYIHIQAIVETNGTITLREKADAPVQEYILEAINSLGPWSPARFRGRPVRQSVYFLLKNRL